MGHGGTLTAAAGRMALKISGALTQGIEAKDFGSLPRVDGAVVMANSPAFIYGHLAIYPGMAAVELGLENPESYAAPESYEALFKHGVDVVDDPDNTIYPPMAELLEQFQTLHEKLFATIEGLDDEVLARPTEREGMKNMFPTKGEMMAAMFGAHTSFHLGQLSTWRRCMGMGSAM